MHVIIDYSKDKILIFNYAWKNPKSNASEVELGFLHDKNYIHVHINVCDCC